MLHQANAKAACSPFLEISNGFYRAHLRSFGFYEKMLGSVYSKCHGLFKQSDRFRMGNHRASVVGGVASEEEDSSPGLELSRPDGRHLLSPQEWMQLGGLAQRFAPLLNGLLRVVSCFQRIIYGLRRRIISHPFGINVLSEYRRPSHYIAQQRVLMVLSLGLEFQLIRPKMGMF